MLTVSGALSAVVLFVAGTAWGFTSYINDTIGRVNAGTAGTPSSGPLNVLLAGVDQRSGLTRHQQLALHVGRAVSSNSDTLMLIHVSGDRSRVTVISIPRDSWVNIPGHGMNKINAAYGLGGPKLVVQTVEANTGLTINDFIQVNFLGFVKVIDALGGVNICLPFAVDDSYSGLHLSGGTHHVAASPRWSTPGTGTRSPPRTWPGSRTSSACCPRCSTRRSAPGRWPTRSSWTGSCGPRWPRSRLTRASTWPRSRTRCAASPRATSGS